MFDNNNVAVATFQCVGVVHRCWEERFFRRICRGESKLLEAYVSLSLDTELTAHQDRDGYKGGQTKFEVALWSSRDAVQIAVHPDPKLTIQSDPPCHCCRTLDMMRLSWTVAALAMLGLASGAQAATLIWDCTRVPNICSNDCYAIQCAGKPTRLHRDSANASINRANTACRSPNRCAGKPADSNSCGKPACLLSSVIVERTSDC